MESGRGMTLTPHPVLVPRSKNRVQLYYSPYRPSWPVKRVKPTYVGICVCVCVSEGNYRSLRIIRVPPET
jgi:hypothetical protein